MTKNYKTGEERRIQLAVDDLLFMAAGGEREVKCSNDGEQSHSIVLTEDAQAFMKELFRP